METEHLQACWNSKFKEWTGENAVSVQTKTKWLVVMHVMKSANCGLARRLKNGRWIALWSHWKHTGMKKWQIKKYINEVYSDIFKLKNTKMNWQKCGSVQTEVKLLVTSHPNYWWLDEPWSLASSSETATSNMPSDEESVIVKAFTSVHTSRKEGKINKASVLTKLPHSMDPWRSLNW